MEDYYKELIHFIIFMVDIISKHNTKKLISVIKNIHLHDCNLHKLKEKFIIFLNVLMELDEEEDSYCKIVANTLSKLKTQELEFWCLLFSNHICFETLMEILFENKDKLTDKQYLHHCNMMKYGKELKDNAKYHNCFEIDE